MKNRLVVALLTLGITAAAVAPGCGGGTEGPEAPAASGAAQAAIPDSLVAETWIIQATKPEVLNNFLGNPGWNRLIGKRDYRGAVLQLGEVGGLTTARAHAEAADMYRQAALMAANSLIEVYGKTPNDTDPVAAAHLLTVSYAVVGRLDDAKAAAAKLSEGAGEAAAWHAPWKAWLDSGAAWPPDLSALPMDLPAVAAAEWPEPPTTPHYSLAERVDGDPAAAPRIDVSDPGALVALALWHDAVARAAAGDQADAVALFGARYRLPAEGALAAPPVDKSALPIELLFGSDLLTAGDAAFLAAAFAKSDTTPYEASSLIASLSKSARVDGKIDPEKANDLAAQLRNRLLDDQKAVEGTTTGTHRTFADIAQVAVLRNLAFLAELEGNREVSGILRINAMEKSAETWTACPTATLSLAAWDASNRYPLRPTEKLHNLIARYPSLETARFSLEVLALRVSRETPGGTPGN